MDAGNTAKAVTTVYMYYLDNQRGKSGEEIYRVKTNFNKPLKKDRQGHFHIKSGESLRVCMTSDFFLEEADAWRDDVWNIMRQRPDVHFWLLTKTGIPYTGLPSLGLAGWLGPCIAECDGRKPETRRGTAADFTQSTS